MRSKKEQAKDIKLILLHCYYYELNKLIKIYVSQLEMKFSRHFTHADNNDITLNCWELHAVMIRYNAQLQLWHLFISRSVLFSYSFLFPQLGEYSSKDCAIGTVLFHLNFLYCDLIIDRINIDCCNLFCCCGAWNCVVKPILTHKLNFTKAKIYSLQFLFSDV